MVVFPQSSHDLNSSLDSQVLFFGDGNIQHNDPGVGEALEGAEPGRFCDETGPEGVVRILPTKRVHGTKIRHLPASPAR